MFPTGDEYDRAKSWCLQAIHAGEQARQPYEPNWSRYFKLYRSYIKAKKRGDWRSRVFMPETFQTVETILPRLVANLPTFLVLPHGEEDIETAKTMAELLKWSIENSRVHVSIIDSFRDALIYGTGILRTYLNGPEDPDYWGYKRQTVPVFEERTQELRRPMIDPETGMPLLDLDGNPQIQIEEFPSQVPVGTKTVRERFVKYEGPKAASVDPFNFWVAPESEDIDSARYAIEREYCEVEYILRKAEQGIYTLPDDMDLETFFEPIDEPMRERLDSIDLGPGSDPTRKQGELRHIWTKDGRVLTMLNKSHLIRVAENPFDHGQKPFIPIYDYRQSHQFWGVGEVEVMGPLNDLINSLTNQRVDNVRMGMDQTYVFVRDHLRDPNQIKRRHPGQGIELKNTGIMPHEAIHALPVQETTQSAFEEVEQAKQWSERATGNSNYQRGDDPLGTDTATGASLLMEAGQNRFGLKSTQAELDSFKRLGLHFGSMLQQFITEPVMVRLDGLNGSFEFQTLDPMSLQGSFDYCADEDTEILTIEGWKRFDEVRPGDIALTLNTETQLSEWQPIEDVHIFPAKQREMMFIEGLGLSVLVTPQHRWPTMKRTMVGGSSERVPAWATSETLNTLHSLITAVPCATLPEMPKYSDEYVEMVAWYWTEGNLIRPKGRTAAASISQSHSANPDYVARIRKCLTRLFGSPAKVRDGGQWYEYRFPTRLITSFTLCKTIAQELEEIAPNKVVSTDFVTSLTEAQLRLFVEVSLAADGWEAASNGQVGISQKYEDRLRPFELACALLGIRTNTFPIPNGFQTTLWRRSTLTTPVAESRRGRYEGSMKMGSAEYEGKVWCPRTENQTWLARRRGTVYYTGNTIEPSSIVQSETMRRDQAMQMMSTLAPLFQAFFNPQTGQVQLPPQIQALVEDLFDAFNKKDKQRYATQQAPAQPQLPMAPEMVQ